MAIQASEPSLTGRSKSEIEADLGANRDRLAASVAELIDVVHPKRVKERTVGRIKAELQARVADARAYFINSRGDVRTDHVVTVSSIVAGTIAVVVTLRKLLGRRRR